MRLTMNIAGAPVDKLANMKWNAGSSIAGVAAAEARRRRVKRDGGLLKKKRTKTVPDSEFVPPPLPPHIINQESLVLLFYKKLQMSDLNNVGRTILPKNSAETHLPRLLDNEKIILPVLDMDGPGVWTFKFRYWLNNHSRMYVFEGTGPFTRKYKLQTGDYMVMYRDMNWNYFIRAVKASEDEKSANKEVTAVEGTNTDDVVPNDADSRALDLTKFPGIESATGLSSMNYDGYFSEILNSFSSWDEIEDYYLSPTQPNVSSDNISSDQPNVSSDNMSGDQPNVSSDNMSSDDLSFGCK